MPIHQPITDAQLAANRANAQKSTGPTTPGGKRNSSQNALTHGFLARSILLPGESPDRFHALLASYTTQFLPASQDEHDLIETMAVCRWRILRGWTLEAAALIHEQRQQAGSTADEDPPTQAMLASRALQHPPRSQEALAHHEIRLDRAYHRAADRLRQIQAARNRETKEAPEQSHQLIENTTESFAPPSQSNPERTLNEPVTKPERTPHFKAFICVHLCPSVAPLSSSSSSHLTTTHSYFIIDSEPIAAPALAEFITNKEVL
jgi:hypothetical protein